MGYTFRMNDDFSSIPGLKLWLDARFGASFHPDGKVKQLSDLSGNGFDFSMTKNARAPLWIDNKWIKSQNEIGVTDMNNAGRSYMNFLHNGSPYGYYHILKAPFTALSITLFRTTDNAGSGQQFTMGPTTAGGSFIATTRNAGAAVRQLLAANLKTVGNPNFISFPAVLNVSHFFTGPNLANNQVNRVNHVVVTSTDTSILSEYPTINGNQCQLNVGANQTDDYIQTGAMLIYDWTGFTVPEMTAFDVRVRSLMDSLLPSFN